MLSQLFAGISGTPGVQGQPRVAPLQRSWGPATSLGARSHSPVPGAITRPRRCFGGPAQQPSPGGSPLRAAKRRAGPRGSSCVPRGSVRVGNGPRPAPGRERRTGNTAAALQRFFYARGTICQGLQRSSSSQTSETLRNCTPPLSPLRERAPLRLLRTPARGAVSGGERSCVFHRPSPLAASAHEDQPPLTRGPCGPGPTTEPGASSGPQAGGPRVLPGQEVGQGRGAPGRQRASG